MALDININVEAMDRRPRIVICGNYGATNLGDEAILDGILSMVRRALPAAEIVVLSANPTETADLYGVKSVFLLPAGVRSFWRGFVGGRRGSILATLDAIRSADLFILGGGGLFTDEKFMAILIWSLQARFARFFKVPIFCFGQSVGPLRTFFGRWMTARVFKSAAAITVRDESSRDLLMRLGVDDAVVLADPALVLPDPEPLPESNESYIVLSVRPWKKHLVKEDFHEGLAKFIDWLWREKGLKTVMVPFQIMVDNDVNELNCVYDLLGNKNAAEISAYGSDYRETMELMARATAVVGMRLHSLIFASLCSTPFLALSYSEKVRGFCGQMQMEEFVLDLKEVNFDVMKERFERILSERDKLILVLEDRTLHLRAKALEHEEILKKLTKEVKNELGEVTKNGLTIA